MSRLKNFLGCNKSKTKFWATTARYNNTTLVDNALIAARDEKDVAEFWSDYISKNILQGKITRSDLDKYYIDNPGEFKIE